MEKKKVTLKDIAARTGLSVNTVSRVLNKKPYYTKDVEARVNAACKELGYIVDMNASGLRSGSTRTIAILYDDLVNPFYSYTTDIISKRFEKSGYKLSGWKIGDKFFKAGQKVTFSELAALVEDVKADAEIVLHPVFDKVDNPGSGSSGTSDGRTNVNTGVNC